MIALKEIELGRYDLTNEADVQRLAVELGAVWAQAIVPLSAHVSEKHLGIFFGYLFGAPFGAMGRSIGIENTRAVVDELVKAVEFVLDERRHAVH